ncbi:unannotated protein [freshwater metagenome]|uniref:Unannotated protein n=1 Tax=freshwater metagenome TaxID=449393 RepID=A0A6J7FZJ0_9ZZZZ|nr:hypothetical protein [Actinomycetota bacterium]
MFFEKKLRKLVERAESSVSGEVTVTVREIRDVYWKSSRLTARDRKKIDEELREEGAEASPALATGVGLDEQVRVSHVETRREHQKLLKQRARDQQIARALVQEIKEAPDDRLTLTRGELAKRFDRRNARALTATDRQSIVSALTQATVLSDPPLAVSGTGWGEQAPVVLALPSTSRVGRTGKRVLAGVAALILLILVIGAVSGNDQDERPTGEQNAAALESTSTDAAEVVPTETTETTEDPRGVAEAAEERGDYDEAIAAYVALGEDDDANRVRRVAALVVLRRARSAYRDGRYVTARRQARSAIRRYGTQATGATRIKNQSTRRIDAAAARRAARAEARRVAAAQRRAVARQARADRVAARRAQEAADAAAAATPEPEYAEPDSGGGVSSGGRAGCNPATARDGDGDGIVCE